MNSDSAIPVNRASGISKAYRQYYSRMADHFIEELGKRRVKLVLEAGCGKGQLTIPLLKMLHPKARMVAVDSASGPYEGWVTELRSALAKEKFAGRVRVVESDARRMQQVRSVSIDFLFSNELLCDLTTEADLLSALHEFHRVLKPHGVMLHGEWSSHPVNLFGDLKVKHFPTWTPDQLHSAMTKTGFENVHISYFDSTISFGYEAAVEELRNWGASRTFLKRHDSALRRSGFQLPPEHVVRCEKY